MSKKDDLSTLLRAMELSELEVKIYIWLLQHKRNTGYKIALEIGKPVANTYKALKSLQSKGAVIIDNSANKAIFDTVPVEEFLNKIENEFARKKRKILDEVQKLEVKQEQTGIYEIQSRELVFEKTNSMIKSAKNQLLIDAFPAPMKIIKAQIDKNKHNDVSVYIKNYASEEIENVHQIKASIPDFIYTELNGQWLIVLRDTVESLIAFFNKDGSELIHSVWTYDPFISFVLFNGSAYEFNFTEICEHIYSDEADKIENIKRIIERYKKMYKYMRIEEGRIFKNSIKNE